MLTSIRAALELTAMTSAIAVITTEMITNIATQIVVLLGAFTLFYREITKIRAEARVAAIAADIAAKEIAAKAAEAATQAAIAAEKAKVADKKLDTISEHVNGSLARSETKNEATQEMLKQLFALLQSAAEERKELAVIAAAPKVPQDVNVVNAAQPVHDINPPEAPVPITPVSPADVGAIADAVDKKAKESAAEEELNQP